MPDHNIESRIGPSVRHLEEIARAAKTFETSIKIEFDSSKPIPINAARTPVLIVVNTSQPITQPPNSLADLYHGREVYSYRGLLGEGMITMADFCKGDRPFTERGRVLPDSITVKSRGGTVPAKELKKLALEAWCEALGVRPGDFQELNADKNAKKLALENLKTDLLEELRSGPEGVKRWNTRISEQSNCKFKKSNLEAANLPEVYMYGLDFQSSNFNNATVTKGRILKCDVRNSTFREAHMEGFQFAVGTNFTGCDLTRAMLSYAKLDGKFSDCNFTAAVLTQARLEGTGFDKCRFVDADLTGATLWECDLRGADLSQANLSEVTFERSLYDQDTRWPPHFVYPTHGLEWKGSGADPILLKRIQDNAPGEPVNFESFLQHLSTNFDRDRLNKSIKMLQSERFQLFCKFSHDSIVGIVNSQTNLALVYSCRLTSEGRFFCCTQNLVPCGGLRGALCKHLLVLLVGLAKAEELDPGQIYQWVIKSQAQKPELDKELASATFLHYKGAEAGEIDWRPTETIPEDYYTF